MVTTVIVDNEKYNFNVVVLSSDNLPLNQSLFNLFSRNHVIEQSVPHPCVQGIIQTSAIALLFLN